MNSENYFAFQVRTKTRNQMSIGYNLKIEKLEATSGYTLLNDNEVKVYLTDYEEKGLIKPTLVSDLDNYIIYKKYHNHNNENEEVISKYKLRVWLDENVTGENWTKDTKIQYSFKIGVNSLENKTYKVIFNSNTDKEEVKTQYIGYNESLELEKNTFTKEGYRFIGWSTTKDGEVKYQDREKVTNISGNNESINLYAVWETGIFNVNVVVQNGIIDDSSTKQVKYQEDILFRLEPNSSLAPGTVSCTNNQVGKLINKELTVLNVTKDTVCTVTYSKDTTVLYNDGTLIINELARDRELNVEKHGTVTKEYEAMSNSNSYVMASASAQPWANERSSIKSVDLGQEISPVSTAYWFHGNNNMTTGKFDTLNTSDVTNMQAMFYRAGYNSTKFELEGLENWDTSKVTDMSSMFRNVASNASEINLNLSKWNTSNVTTMERMFASTCRNAPVCIVGNIGKWDVINVNTMEAMFTYYATKTKNFNIGDIGKWNVSNVSKMTMMFEATAMSSENFILNLSEWNVSNVTNMGGMFLSAGVSAKTFDLGKLNNWNVSKVTSMRNMFGNSGSAATTWSIGDLSSWDTSNVTTMENMFLRVGSSTTVFNSIGTLNIPVNCNMNNFTYSNDSNNGARKFTGNLVINGTLSNYENMLRDTATYSSARINLYYKNAEAERVVDELISLYGPNGTVSKGNIYKVDE